MIPPYSIIKDNIKKIKNLVYWGYMKNKKVRSTKLRTEKRKLIAATQVLVIQANAKIEPALLPKVKTHARLNGHINLRRKFTLSWLKRNIKEKPS